MAASAAKTFFDFALKDLAGVAHPFAQHAGKVGRAAHVCIAHACLCACVVSLCNPGSTHASASVMAAWLWHTRTCP